jgi:hypothetical protein
MAVEDIYAINPVMQQVADTLGISIQLALFVFAVISIWSLVWKGLALWKSSKKEHKIWFVVLLVVNTIGILEILYIYIFSKMDFKKAKKK